MNIGDGCDVGKVASEEESVEIEGLEGRGVEGIEVDMDVAGAEDPDGEDLGERKPKIRKTTAETNESRN